MQRFDASTMDLQEKVVALNRVSKVVKGGRNFRFTAVVVVGDGNGHVGIGSGKAAEISDAIRKGIESAKKEIIEVPRVGTTIPHAIVGRFGAGKVLLKPAEEGTGIIAGGGVRIVLELAGITDVRAKSLGSSNARNAINATMSALKEMKSVEKVAKLRGKTVEEIIG